MKSSYYNRIDEIDDISILSKLVCQEYQLGTYKDTFVIEIGYEDFNAIITSETGKYLMKVFNNSRDDEEVYNCIKRGFIAWKNNVEAPKVYKNKNGDIVTTIIYKEAKFRVSVLEYIDGLNFFALGRKPTMDELNRIIHIACCLNQLSYEPPFIYDTWAISNFCSEYEKKRQYLDQEYIEMIQPIYKRFKKFDYDRLPKSFVHGDMRSTNLMFDKNNKIWVIDFSVANYTARLSEIVVLCDDVALIYGNKEESKKRIKMAFKTWCDGVVATAFEKDSFPLLFDVANAINILNTAYEIKMGNHSEENKMHLKMGLFGLTLFTEE